MTRIREEEDCWYYLPKFKIICIEAAVINY